MLVFASRRAVCVHYPRDIELNFPTLRMRRWELAMAGLLVVWDGEGAAGRAADLPFQRCERGEGNKLRLLEGTYPPAPGEVAILNTQLLP